MRDTNSSLMYRPEPNYEIDGDILYATVPARKRVVAIGAIRPGQPVALTYEAAIGMRAAEVGLIADNLSAEAAAAHQTVVQARYDDVHGFAAMLDALRAGEVAPLVTMTAEELEVVEEEHIGMEHSTTGGHFQ